MQLKQFIPKEFCLRCDVCCQFPQAHTIWAPLFTGPEIEYLVENEILPPLVFTARHINKSNKDSCNTKTISAQRINLIEYKDYFICPCLNPANHKCKIYLNRSFECQIYPFLLIKKVDKFYLAQDKKCPYFKNAKQGEIKNYIDYLKKELQGKQTKSFLKQNKELFVEYPTTDLKLLFVIDID